MIKSRPLFIATVFLTMIAVYFIQKKYFSKKQLKTIPLEFIGTWETDCLPLDIGPTKRRIRIDRDKEYDVLETTYLAPHCPEDQKAINYEYRGFIRLEYGSKQNHYNLTYHNVEMNVQVANAKAEQAANKSQLLGKSDWRAHRWAKFIPPMKYSYDIVKHTGKELFFGDPESGDQTSQKTRPKRYETIAYKRISGSAK